MSSKLRDHIVVFRRLLLAFAHMLVCSASLANAAVAAKGDLVHKPCTAGCVSDTGAGPCPDGTALELTNSVTVSPDGQSAYVASDDSNAVVVFDRAADGTLTQKAWTAGCISDTGNAGACVHGTALNGAASEVLSPDGQSAYVGSSSR